MTKGKRSGYVTIEVLAQRIYAHLTSQGRIDASGASTSSAPAPQPCPSITHLKALGVKRLLGHARYYKLVDDVEFAETIPRTESTIPCYLHTHVEDACRRQAIEDYVKVASRLYRRGTLIANIIAMNVLGSRAPGAGDILVPTMRPRFDDFLRSAVDLNTQAFVDLLSQDDPRAGHLKHVFLPERWPSKEVARWSRVQEVLDGPFRDSLPPEPSWRSVMHPTGWDNAINRMATKFRGNLIVHARARLTEAIKAYIWVAPLREGTCATILQQVTVGPLRPLSEVHDDDWNMMMDIRECIVDPEEPTWYPLDNPPLTWKLLTLHFFLTRFGTTERTYLPVASRGRKYCFIDTKVATSLFAHAARKRKAVEKAAKKTTTKTTRGSRAGRQRTEKDVEKKATTDGDSKGEAEERRGGDGPPPDEGGMDADGDEVHATRSVGEVLGITVESFNRIRKRLANRLRRQYRADVRRATSRAARKRAKKLRGKWSMHGVHHGRLPPQARIDSVETDGVGLRLCVKLPVDLTSFISPVVVDAGDRGADAPKKRRGRRKKVGRSSATAVEVVQGFEAVDPLDPSIERPLCGALDLGRAKLFTAAVQTKPYKKPTTVTFTRKRYYHEMHDRPRKRWEKQRLDARPDVREALTLLSQSGGARNCDMEMWRQYLEAEAEHRDVLDTEFVDEIERALWTMRMFRWKKASLDRAVRRLFRAMTDGQSKTRPLALFIGDAGFACTGKGEVPAPTSKLSCALKRGIVCERARGRSVVVLRPNEFRTTMCCCACGSVTAAPRVNKRATRGSEATRGPSARLRSCTMCSPTGKLRDRDVQAARNILWLGLAMYYGIERPEYMRRPVVKKKPS